MNYRIKYRGGGYGGNTETLFISPVDGLSVKVPLAGFLWVKVSGGWEIQQTVLDSKIYGSLMFVNGRSRATKPLTMTRGKTVLMPWGFGRCNDFFSDGSREAAELEQLAQ